MANLTWLAIDTGHYAVLTIEPGTTESYNTGLASYNLVKIFPTNMYVNNSGNSIQATINYRNTPSFSVPAFSSTPIQLTGDGVLTLTNGGSTAIVLILSDHELPGYIAQLFASLSLSAIDSNQTLLNHFENGLLLNSGSGEGFEYTQYGQVKTSGVAKFQQRSLSLLDNGSPGATGIVIAKTGGFDMSKDFTIDAWFRPPVLDSSRKYMLFRFGDSQGASKNSGVMLYFTNSQLRLIINGADTLVTTLNFPNNIYKHILISKINNDFYMGIDGTVPAAVNNSVADIYDDLAIGYNNITDLTNIKNIIGEIDEFRYLSDIGLYNAGFTPPNAPYD